MQVEAYQKGGEPACRNIPEETAMPCDRMPFAVPERCTTVPYHRRKYNRSVMIFYRWREEAAASKPPPSKPSQIGIFGNWNPTELLEKLDKDQILILVLLVMLYKEGGDKKLMMALAYLLT